MAVLHRLISVAGETAGFLLPIFRTYPMSNQELIQHIDLHDHIVSLEPIVVGAPSDIKWTANIEVQIGERALWAFRDPLGGIHMGRAADIQKAGLELLSNNSLGSCPMAAAEMAAFCNAEEEYPEVMLSAFNTLREFSGHGAETWRDTVVLLPKIKEDLAHQLKPSVREKIDLNDVFAITHRSVTHIYAPELLTSSMVDLPRWYKLASIFGIQRFQIHPINPQSKKAVARVPEWSLFGFGGIARYVIERSPFFGSKFSKDGILAKGPLVQTTNIRLMIGIVTSDMRYMRQVSHIAHDMPTTGTTKHAINIRPIGFGTPRKDKLSPMAIRKAFNDFDCVWLVANHRQRQTGTFTVNFTASNIASRIARAASSGLIACLHMEKGMELLSEAGKERGFGLVGAVKFTGALEMREMIRRVLYSMLCEDAHLHSASKIAILWPYDIDANHREIIELGAHRYMVELFSRPKTNRFQDVVGFALNVQLSGRTKQEFSDFCLSLTAGYSWTLRRREGLSFLLENEGAVMRIWPAISLDDAFNIMTSSRKFDRDHDLVITNQTIPHTVRTQAKSRNWNFAHYSELGRWMKSEHRMGVFKDA